LHLRRCARPVDGGTSHFPMDPGSDTCKYFHPVSRGELAKAPETNEEETDIASNRIYVRIGSVRHMYRTHPVRNDPDDIRRDIRNVGRDSRRAMPPPSILRRADVDGGHLHSMASDRLRRSAPPTPRWYGPGRPSLPWTTTG